MGKAVIFTRILYKNDSGNRFINIDLLNFVQKLYNLSFDNEKIIDARIDNYIIRNMIQRHLKNQENCSQIRVLI